jgi:ABC-type lipoprotein release transport system permease subunit
MERSRLLLSLAWRNLWRNPRRTALVLIAVAVGVWSMLTSTAALKAWNESSLDAALKDMTGQGQIHAKGYLDDPGVGHRMGPVSGELEALLNNPEVSRWAERVRVPAAIQSEYETWPISMIGIDPEKEMGLSFIATAVTEGRALANSGDPGIVLGRKLAKRLHTAIGKRVVLMSQDCSGSLAERGFRVKGLFSASPEVEERYAFIGISQAEDMLRMGSAVSEIAFDLRGGSDLPDFIARLRKAAPDLDVKSWDTLRPLTKAITQIMNGFIEVWIVIMFVLMAFGIVNTIMMSLHERVRELALLQALGLRPGLIFGQVTLESALLVVLGIAAGAVLAFATIEWFRNGLDLGFLARGAQWFGAGKVLYPKFKASQFIGTSILVWILGIIAGLWPTWRIVRRVPVEAISRSTT